MQYLSKKSDLESVIVVGNRPMPRATPVFYSGRIGSRYEEFVGDSNNTWHHYKKNKEYLPQEYIFVFTLGTQKSLAELNSEIKLSGKKPNYMIFRGEKDLQHRVEILKLAYGELEFMTMISPSWFDRVMFYLNPRHNPDETSYIYKISPGTG